jgi:DNA-3-methyladenine glycosylase II
LDFELTQRHLKLALDRLAKKDSDIALALKQVGYPDERRRGAPSFENFLRIIAGQQLSVKAAATIFGRVEAALQGNFQPDHFLSLSDSELRAAGFSRQKIAYARGLSEAVIEQRLDPSGLAALPDDQVVEKITALKGFGRWSAEMFLLFSLGRPDVWPADDLAIQAGVQRLKGLSERPNRRQTDALAEPWRPHRGAAAIFIWHFYSNAPLP